MRTTKIYLPDSVDRFRCTGAECEDTCCTGWTVHVDRASFERYQSLPDGPFASLVRGNLVQIAPAEATERRFGHIRIADGSSCPLLSDDQLCRVQLELGAEALCNTCKEYPRQGQRIDGLLEEPLMLSCPEAARIVLLDTERPGARRTGGHCITWDDQPATPQPLRFYFWQIRAFAVELLLNRAYPLWQRMFLLGSFSRRLHALQAGELNRGFPALLADFEATVQEGSIRRAMETVQPDLRLQIDIVLRLIALRAAQARAGTRFGSCLDAFIDGIGQNAGATEEAQIKHYRDNYALHYAPLVARSPHILENYLVHTLFRDRFPFGDALFIPDAQCEPAAAFTRLAVQFALIKGMLIGVSGHYGGAFSVEHAVMAAQVVSRQFEHSPEFLTIAARMLADRGLDSPHGLAMLLRN